MSNDFSNHWDLILLVHTVAFPPSPHPPPPTHQPHFFCLLLQREKILFLLHELIQGLWLVIWQLLQCKIV